MNPEKELNRIYSFIGVEYSSKMKEVILINSSFEDGYKSDKKGFRKEPIYWWKKHINPRYNKIMKFILKKDMKKMGYL